MVMDKMTVFPEDEVETHTDKVANLTARGTSLNVLGKSHIKYHVESAELLSGGTSVSTTSRFMIKSGCFSAQPAAETGSRYSVVPYQGRIYIHAEQGDLLVKTKREMRVPSGKTVAITSCGKPGEVVQFAGDSNVISKLLFGSAVATGAASSIIIKQAISGECPTRSCR